MLLRDTLIDGELVKENTDEGKTVSDVPKSPEATNLNNFSSFYMPLTALQWIRKAA